MMVVKIKKWKAQKSVSWKENLNLKIIKTVVTTQFENKINHLEKSKIDMDSVQENHKGIKTNKSTSKIQ